MEDRPLSAAHLDPASILDHSSWLRALARSLVMDGESVDDLVQEAWTAALQRPPADGVPLKAWLAGILRRKALFQRRGRIRASRREENAAKPEGIPSGEQLLEQTELQSLLLEEVRALPEAYCEALLLRYFEGLGPTQIAEHTGTPLNTVRTRLQRGLERLRLRLDERYDGDRQAWGLALLPLAMRPAPAALSVGSASFLSSLTTAMLMNLSWKPLLALPILLLSVTWLALRSPKPELDLRRRSPATEVLAELESLQQEAPAERVEVPARRAALPASAEATRSVRVVDLQDRPVPNAVVGSSRELPTRFTRRNLDAMLRVGSRTDGLGKLPLSPRSQDWVRVVHRNYVSIAAAVSVKEEGETTVTMAPLLRETFEVRVVDGFGEPVPRFNLQADVLLSGEKDKHDVPWQVYSQQHARVPVTLELEVIEPRPVRFQIRPLGLDPSLAPADLVRTVKVVPGSRHIVTFQVDLEDRAPDAGFVATGQVLDHATGEAVPGAEIWLHPRKGPSSFGVTDQATQTRMDGHFRAIAPSGGPDALVRVMHPHYQPAQAMFDGSHPVEVRLLPRASLTVVVQDRSGLGRAGVHLSLRRPQGGSRQATFENTRSQWRGVTDDDGRCLFPHLEEATYTVSILPGGTSSDEEALLSRRFEISAGQAVEKVLPLDASDRVTVHGRASGQGGEDLMPLFLPHAKEGSWVVGRPGEGASYEAGGLDRGRYCVVLGAANDDTRGPIAVLANLAIDGQSSQVCNFHWPAGSCSGQIEGVPPGLRVAAVPRLDLGFAHDFFQTENALKRLAVPVGDDGSFRIEHLSAGSWELRLLGADYRLLQRVEIELGRGHLEVPRIPFEPAAR